MSRSFEITIKPGPSRVYLRLIIIVSLLSVGLILYASLYLLIKCVLIFWLAALLREDLRHSSPCGSIKEIQFIAQKWILRMKKGNDQSYEEASVLIHNILFQLIQFSSTKQKKLLILFHDQVSDEQLRLLHFKIAAN